MKIKEKKKTERKIKEGMRKISPRGHYLLKNKNNPDMISGLFLHSYCITLSYSIFVPSAGIEPAFQAPQACVLSIGLRGL